MITEDYVSFETAKLLKEKGFDEATHKFYKAITYLGTEANSICIKSLDGIEEEPFHNSVYGVDFNGEDSGEYACPTLQMTMKWLRETHNIHINLDVHYLCFAKALGWMYTITKILENGVDYVESKGDENDKTFYSNYEEACEGAIRYCLENLI